MRVGVDLDDVVTPWASVAVDLCRQAGLTGGLPAADHWRFWTGWPCTEAQVWAVLDHATVHGGLYDSPPYPGAVRHLARLRKAGHVVNLVTARGFVGEHAELIRRLTVEWVARWNVPHDSLTFAADKTAVASGSGWWFLDDSIRNYDALAAAGVQARLLTRPHNRQPDGDLRARVRSVKEFADEVLASEQVARRLRRDRTAVA